MSRELKIRNETFQYPENGTDSDESYGEQAVDFAEAVADALGTLLGPNDINLTTISLEDNISTPTPIPLLKFSSTQVIKLSVDLIITRIISGITYVDSAKIEGNSNGNEFRIAQVFEGDETGIELSIDNTGQFLYTSTNTSHTSCTIIFKASTISNI